MFLYNWKKIYDAANGSTTECFRIFEMLVKSKIPNNRYDKIYRYRNTDFSGRSFLVHADVLLYNSFHYSPREIAIYLSIAGLRKLPHWIATKDTTLDLLHVPDEDVVLEALYESRLFHIEDRKVHFKYEEAPTKEEIN
jgi:hypothetical protein